MLPLPNSRVFRSRWGALRWSLLVIAAAVLTVGFAGSGDTPAAPTDATGQPIDNADAAALQNALDAL